MSGNPENVLLCVICEKRVSAQECKFHDKGQPVHESCYVQSLSQGAKHGMTIPVSIELTDYELILLINTLGNYITEKAHSGMDTNDLPETKLRLKLIQATNRPRPV